MRFKFDENLPPFMADRLRGAGFDALTVAEQSLGGTPDANLAAICASENRILITLDLGFADVRQYPPGTGPGFIVLRLDNQDRSDFVAATKLLIEVLADNEVSGSLWIVEKSRVRVRDKGAG